MPDEARSSELKNRLHKALGHAMRRTILKEMADRGETSPTDMSKITGLRVGQVSYHMRILAKCEAITMTRTRDIQGATQHFYRFAVEDPWVFQALGLAPPVQAEEQPT